MPSSSRLAAKSSPSKVRPQTSPAPPSKRPQEKRVHPLEAVQRERSPPTSRLSALSRFLPVRDRRRVFRLCVSRLVEVLLEALQLLVDVEQFRDSTSDAVSDGLGEALVANGQGGRHVRPRPGAVDFVSVSHWRRFVTRRISSWLPTRRASRSTSRLKPVPAAGEARLQREDHYPHRGGPKRNRPSPGAGEERPLARGRRAVETRRFLAPRRSTSERGPALVFAVRLLKRWISVCGV